MLFREQKGKGKNTTEKIQNRKRCLGDLLDALVNLPRRWRGNRKALALCSADGAPLTGVYQVDLGSTMRMLRCRLMLSGNLIVAH